MRIASKLREMAENLWSVEHRINVDEDAKLLIAAAVIIDLYEERLAQFERTLRDIANLRVPPKRVKFLQDMASRALRGPPADTETPPKAWLEAKAEIDDGWPDERPNARNSGTID